MSKQDLGFTIKQSITEDDIPPQGGFRKSKYDPVLKSAGTLEPAEGVEIEIEKASQANTIRHLLENRHKRRHYLVTQRSTPKGCRCYIVRKQ